MQNSRGHRNDKINLPMQMVLSEMYCRRYGNTESMFAMLEQSI